MQRMFDDSNSKSHPSILFRINERRLRAELARRLKTARTETYGARSQADFARRLGIRQSQISKWEGGVSFPRLPLLIQFAELCHRDVSDLIGDLATPAAFQEKLGLDRVEPEARGVVLRLID